MSVKTNSAIALMSFLVVAPTASAAVIFDSQGFESPPFTVGALSGQNGWGYYSESSSADKTQDVVVQNSIAHEGSQAVLVKATGARTMARRTQVAMTGEHYMDVWLRTPSVADDYYRNVSIHMRGKHAITTEAGTEIKSGLEETVQLTKAGVVSGFAGATFTIGDWTRFTVYNDLEANRWSLYINGQLVVQDQAYDNADVVEINQWDFDWTSVSNPAGSSLYVDDFQILDDNPIPEPASAALWIGAVGAAMMSRRCRRRGD